MRITFITTKLNFDTAGGSVYDIDVKVRGLQSLGNEVRVVTTFSYNNKNIALVPYRVIEENIPSRRLLGIQMGVYRLLKKHESDTDVYHIDGQVFLYGAGAYRMFGGKPVVAFFNQKLFSWPNQSDGLGDRGNTFSKIKKHIRYWIERWIGMRLVNRIDLVNFTTHQLYTLYRQFGLRKNIPTVVIGCDLLDCAQISRTNGITRDTYARRIKRTGPLTIFYSGRMVAGKGFNLLLDAFALLSSQENHELVLSGDGPEANTIKAHVATLGLVNRVRFTGWVSKDELYHLFNTADIFVFPKWGFELSAVLVLEAMAFGLPLVVPVGGGIASIAADAAITFAWDDPQDLARAIDTLARSPDLRLRLSISCFNRLAKLDAHKKVAQMWEKIQEAVRTSL